MENNVTLSDKDNKKEGELRAPSDTSKTIEVQDS
jgi:hypothetical protein